ncbi:MAG: hypothetical protein NTV61_11505 [Candidatus Bathyarchaeota archaeon]|nr:hypothetical protein [Candidatus Bathyarchaeota archaeon]
MRDHDISETEATALEIQSDRNLCLFFASELLAIHEGRPVYLSANRMQTLGRYGLVFAQRRLRRKLALTSKALAILGVENMNKTIEPTGGLSRNCTRPTEGGDPRDLEAKP